MKKEITNLAKKTASDLATKPISRKEAIKKTGYMAVSAATMMLLLNNSAQAGGGGPQTSHKFSNHSPRHSHHQSTNQGTSKDNGIWK